MLPMRNLSFIMQSEMVCLLGIYVMSDCISVVICVYLMLYLSAYLMSYMSVYVMSYMSVYLMSYMSVYVMSYMSVYLMSYMSVLICLCFDFIFVCVCHATDVCEPYFTFFSWYNIIAVFVSLWCHISVYLMSCMSFFGKILN